MATDLLSTTFAALADPTRRAILARLAVGPATVKELSAPFSMSGPAVSKHLRLDGYLHQLKEKEQDHGHSE
jgi:DNA-binding transcriptional ArsR family regulator